MPPEKAHGVEDDEKGTCLVTDGADDDGDPTGGSQEDHDGIEEDGEEDILSDDGEGFLTKGDSCGDIEEVVVEQRHVGGLAGDVGSPGAHGDTDAGDSEGGGVIDSVADHGDGMAAIHEGSDLPGLVLGEESGCDLLDTQ